MKRWMLLALGTAVCLAGLHGRWEIAGAVWIYPLLFLRFSRTAKTLTGVLGVWAAIAAGTVYWLYESGLLLQLASSPAATASASSPERSSWWARRSASRCWNRTETSCWRASGAWRPPRAPMWSWECSSSPGRRPSTSATRPS
ncbi:hypothetical protein [Thermoactinospora rubra]|uniref:hypothetical protein n=1 Tax=Thermoactinospora rubra TaxID=1088767 RepID=UPI001301EB15|nr:hypothetical protein [Thermoactinospora rubra]